MAYWQVREGFNNRDIENIDKIQLDDILFLVKEGVFVSYGRCVDNNVDGTEVDEWKNLPLEPTSLLSSIERGHYNQKIALIKNSQKIDELLNLIEPLKVYKIQTLKVTNFRLIEELEIDFNEDVNVIIANNGAGKTTVLDAIAIGLGVMVNKFSDGLPFREKDLRINAQNKLENFMRIRIKSSDNLVWDINKNKPKISTRMREAIPARYGDKELTPFTDKIIDAQYDDQAFEMPLVIYYKTNRAVFDSPMRKRNFKKTFSRFDALDGVLQRDANFHRLFQWFDAMEDMERRERDKQKDYSFNLDELQEVRKAIESMLPNFKNPRIETHPLRFMIDRVEEDGSVISLDIEQLSDGYRTILAMVMDISARMSQANPHLGNDSKAIILIDEVDLHLHPKWQQTILPDLKRTFPNAQFIVTTHSPQILSTVQKEKIFILEDGKITKPFDTPYAKRSIVALEDIMATNSMPPLKEAELLENYLDKIHQGDIDSQDVLEMRKELNQLYGANYQQLKIADMIINKYKALRK